MKHKTFLQLAAWTLTLGFFLASCQPAPPSQASSAVKTPPATSESPAAEQAPLKASITFTQGTVTVDGKEAGIGQSIANHAVIKTQAQSVCEIIFNGKNIIKVAPDTIFTLNFDNQNKVIDLQKGELAAVLKKLPQTIGAESLRIRTPLGAAGVRGTTLFVKTDELSSYICVCNGTINVEGGTFPAEPASELLSANHHAARKLTKTAEGVTVDKDAMLYHTDTEMEALAAKINETIDWSKVD